ncbi:MAG: hypothetical protein HC892_03715 [Saprospiraceae bacterium]|nr:hypothetical protein [Saprospiraceae bacterium]
MKILHLILLLSGTASLCAQHAPKKIGLPDVLKEVSGLYVASPDSLWWVNDSGNAPSLYLTNAKGQLVQQVKLPVRNVDWEDLTYDKMGNIYIGDFGNNANQRNNLKIYKYHLSSRALDSIMFNYPDQRAFPPASEDRNFDMEGFFWYNSQLHLFSKNKLPMGNYYTKHYTLSDAPGLQQATLRDSIYLPNRVVTSAAISPDYQTVALLTYDYKVHLKWFPKSKVSIFLLHHFNNTNFLRGDLSEQKSQVFYANFPIRIY